MPTLSSLPRVAGRIALTSTVALCALTAWVAPAVADCDTACTDPAPEAAAPADPDNSPLGGLSTADILRAFSDPTLTYGGPLSMSRPHRCHSDDGGQSCRFYGH
ncbi:hypothetical protein [Nocardia sp. alder85J]|uniref:hypothetical protein n=1 Tax=Nocardia sp. alder85J TaxID=2862949 RepID=UPI001CD74575|nr:hypothetical protein [Nocardia sp. alder85J]MCX4095935.1 hypothetical protein [Nocardia sp. alder85J]